ncbi:hypothetical protein AAMO2058_000417700 [Amorphochlora amoebiformis]
MAPSRSSPATYKALPAFARSMRWRLQALIAVATLASCVWVAPAMHKTRREPQLSAPRSNGCMDPVWRIFCLGPRPERAEDIIKKLEKQLEDQLRRLRIDDRTGKSGNKMPPQIRKDAEATALATMTSIRATQTNNMQELRRFQRRPPKMLQRLEREYREEMLHLSKLREQLNPPRYDETVSQTNVPSLRTSPGLDAITVTQGSPGLTENTAVAVRNMPMDRHGWWVACEDCRAQILSKFDHDLQTQLQRIKLRCDRTKEEVSALFQARIREAQYQHQRDSLQDNFHDFRRELDLRRGQLLHEATSIYQERKQEFLSKVDKLKTETASKLRKVGEELATNLESSRDMAVEKKQKLYAKKMRAFSKMMDKVPVSQNILLLS